MHVSPEDGQDALMKMVKARWTGYEKAGEESFLWVVSLGEALDALKTAVKNGEDTNADYWKDFVEREQKAGNLHFGVRQADRYISVAKRYNNNEIEFKGGCIDFSFGKGGGGKGGGEKLGEITLGNKGTKEWGGAVRWTANGRLTLTWENKDLVEGLAESVEEDSRACESAVKIGAMAFSLVASNDMDLSNKVLCFLTELEQEVAEEVEEA